MKIAVFSVACCASISIAHAQSSVTLYGLIDGGLSYVTNAGGHAQVLENSGVLRNNRWGIMGQEDLGGGWKTVFILENGFTLENGALGQGGLEFGRRAYVGIGNDYGFVTLGRQYDLIVVDGADYSAAIYNTVYAFHQGDIDRLSGERVNSSIKFISNSFRGFSFGALYGFGDPGTPTNTGRTLSAGAHYQNGSFTMGGAYTVVHNSVMPLATFFGITRLFGQTIGTVNATTGALTAVSVNISKLQTSVLGASWDWASWGVRGLVTDTKISVFGNSGNYLTFEGTGVWRPTAALSLSAAYALLRFEGQKYGEASATADYFLSKRTDVYAAVVNMRGYDGARADLLTLATSSSNAQSVFRVGIRHLF